ncbi:MAG: gliding motility-associated C-terminal domain-containing protein, partial [Candidatus Latescibacterota bacterium]|nr:gliding motility-associated C-terminal domain-containing protein [Candidatus Latescibacterota bacterium]
FEPIPARFVRFRWRVWDAACAFGAAVSSQTFTSRNCLVTGWTEEMQVFGEGFPSEVTLRSPLLDLGDGKNLDNLRWASDTPPGTRVEIRTRTGRQIDHVLTFRDKNLKEVTERTWGRLIPSFRGPIDTTLVAGNDWSPWSTIYGTSGERFQSPSPRRYLEIDIRLVTGERDRAPSLDWVVVDFSPPLAGRALGEVTPSQVIPGTRTEFSYFLRTEDSPVGFDRLAIEGSPALEFIEARIDGSTTTATATATEDGFLVSLPRRVREGELIEVRFAASVHLQSTRFEMSLKDSRDGEQIRQRVDAGDANPDVESNSTVVSIPVSAGLFADIDITPDILTANGDGRNDELSVHVDLVNVLSPRPLSLRLYDLAGHLVYRDERLVTAGEHKFTWNGRAEGRLVAPGLYALVVSLEGDARVQKEHRVVAVVY